MKQSLGIWALLLLFFISVNAFGEWILQNTSSTSTLRGVAVIDENTAIAVGNGGIILKTIDGGGTWEPQTSNTTKDLYAVNFPSKLVGWVVGSGIISESNDGGATWNTHSSSNSAFDLSSVYFSDTSTGWSIGGDVILKYTGMDWTRINSSYLYYFSTVYFLNATTGWLVGSNGVILKTTDSGLNWSKTSTKEDIFFSSIDFANETNGLAIGTKSIYGTSDGGENWVEQTHPFTAQLSKVRYSGSEKAWIVGSSGFIGTTNDNGANWISETTNNTNTLYDIQFVNADIGWAVGSNGTILKIVNASNVKRRESPFVSMGLSGMFTFQLAGEYIYNTQVRGATSLTILDVQGKIIKTSDLKSLSYVWDGRNAAGKLLSKGIYILKISAKPTIRKILRLIE